MPALLRIFFTIIVFFAMTQSSFAYASEAINGAKKDIESFKQEMTLKLGSVEKQLEELRAKTKQQGSAIQETTIKDLEITRIKLRNELENLKENSKSNWKQIKMDFAASIDSLHTKLQKALKD